MANRKLRELSLTACDKKTADKKKPTATVVLGDPKDLNGKLKHVGGSCSDRWNYLLLNQTINTFWLKNLDSKALDEQCSAIFAALIGIGPKDELEGMLAAQLLAAHSATMDCYRRAMISEQTFEGRREYLTQANKLSRTYAVLLDTLNRHRGKGQQKVIVEHVHVHAGGQAVVGTVEAPGGGDRVKSEEQPDAKQIAHAPDSQVWSADKERKPVPVASDAERPLSDARRSLAGSPQGYPKCLQARSILRRSNCQASEHRHSVAVYEGFGPSHPGPGLIP